MERRPEDRARSARPSAHRVIIGLPPPGTGQVQAEGISVMNRSQTFLSSKNYVLISKMKTPIL